MNEVKMKYIYVDFTNAFYIHLNIYKNEVL